YFLDSAIGRPLKCAEGVLQIDVAAHLASPYPRIDLPCHVLRNAIQHIYRDTLDARVIRRRCAFGIGTCRISDGLKCLYKCSHAVVGDASKVCARTCRGRLEKTPRGRWRSETEQPKPPRFVAFDTTIEKLGDILARTPRGLLVKRDEIAGWIGAMEKYSNSSRGAAADRGFWLQSFDGGPFTVDRITRGELHIPNLSASLLGGIQPARLAQIHALATDALLQRFLPTLLGPSQLALDRASDDEAYSQL